MLAVAFIWRSPGAATTGTLTFDTLLAAFVSPPESAARLETDVAVLSTCTDTSAVAVAPGAITPKLQV